MDYNFHTHTYRSRHASGTEEEYIQRAISGGIRRMGFSDHIPFRFPDGYESSFRIPLSQVGDYFKDLNQLREKYRGQIEILIGFEMEYYPQYFNEMLLLAKKWGAEYLIHGQHFMYNEHPCGYPTQSNCTSKEEIEHYTDCLISAMQSGVFTYAAHPDVLNFPTNSSLYEEKIGKICLASKETNTPLEINFLGIRGGRSYPTPRFWEIAGETGAPVTFGFDAHSAIDAYDEKSLKIAEEMVEKYNLNYIGEPKIKRLHL